VNAFSPAAPRVVPYDPCWAERYRAEEAVLREALTQFDHAIAHVGSTAVTGLPAKPVIDILVGVPDYDRLREIGVALERVGYRRDVAAEQDEPARKVFRKGPADLRQLRSHHLHLTIRGGHYWCRLLAFRDQLRRDPVAAAEYAAVKASVLRTCGGDSRAYTRGKTDVVRRIERAAGVS
jgi:GrpB-like predicted nucleotidyltransferase (UPF0157 family)